MTATTTAPTSSARPPTGGSSLTGTLTLVRFMLRRDRIRLPAWAGGLGLFVVYLSAALPAAYETDADLRAAVALYNDPIGRMLIGPGYGFEDPTLERFVANGYGLYFMLLAALMSILLVARHTRVEEQSGRAELVRANVVGPHAPLTATLVVASVTNLVAAILIFAAMVGVGGFDAQGSLLFAAGIGALGLAWAGITTVTVQLSEYSRAASGLAGAALGAAFVVRAGGDMAARGGSGLSWASPLAWGQQTAPFVLDRWWPLALPLLFAAAAAGIGFALSARRDLGASRFAVRPGPAEAAPSLGTPFGLALRLQRAGIVGWGLSLAVAGLVFGAYADALFGAVDDMPAAFLELFGAEDLLAGYLGYMALFMAYLVAVYAVMAVQGLRTEETSGRAEPVLSTPLSRWTWLGANLVVAAGAVVVLMLVTGAATGLGVALVTSEPSHLLELTLAHLNHVPAVLVVLGVAALLFGTLPRAVPTTWALVGYGMIVGTFGPMLELPQLVHDLSPFGHAAGMPLEAFAPVPVLVLTLLAVLTAGLGLAAYRRRGINVT